MLTHIQRTPFRLMIETNHISSIAQDNQDKEHYEIQLTNGTIFKNVHKEVITKITSIMRKDL